MKVVLVDDEYYAALALKQELEKIGGIEIAGIYDNGNSLLADIDSINPDITFLDIELSEISGLELSSYIIQKCPSTNIVFVTAHHQYAIQAFELNALDYILKPVIAERLVNTLNRIEPYHYKRITDNGKLIITGFGNLSIKHNKSELTVNWRTKKALELLLYLICKKGRFVSKEMIAEALWPEMDGEKSMANLYITYYYLKKQEKTSRIYFPVESHRGKMRIRLEEVDCDIIDFDNLIENCFIINEKNIDMAEKAEALYKGTVLEDNYYEWLYEIQQQYEITYEKLLNMLVNYYHTFYNKEKYTYYQNKYSLIFN